MTTIIYIKALFFSDKLYLYLANCYITGNATIMYYSFRVSHYVLVLLYIVKYFVDR